VLTIDHCDLRLGNKVEKELYFYDAQRKTFQYHGLERNPWTTPCNTRPTSSTWIDSGPTRFEADFGLKPAQASTHLLRLAVERPLYQDLDQRRRAEPDWPMVAGQDLRDL
jgi:hypothetical protein